MKFEHFGINVPDPVAMAAWYVKHFQMKVLRAMKEDPYTHFLADESGRVWTISQVDRMISRYLTASSENRKTSSSPFWGFSTESCLMS